MKIISNQEYYSMLKIYKFEEFTKSEIRYFKIIGGDDYKMTSKYKFYLDKRFNLRGLSITLDIDKLEDEWFLVKFIRLDNDSNTKYKCDGFDEVKELVKTFPLVNFGEEYLYVMNLLVDSKITEDCFYKNLNLKLDISKDFENIGFAPSRYGSQTYYELNIGRYFKKNNLRPGGIRAYKYRIMGFLSMGYYYIKISILDQECYFKVANLQVLEKIIEKIKNE